MARDFSAGEAASRLNGLETRARLGHYVLHPQEVPQCSPLFPAKLAEWARRISLDVEDRPRRHGRPGFDTEFTVDLVCGNLGVREKLPEAIGLAHKFGFESVAPDAGLLKSLSDSHVSELQDDLKAKKLVWGAAGLGVDFRGTEESFRDGLSKLPADARSLRARRHPYRHLDLAGAQ